MIQRFLGYLLSFLGFLLSFFIMFIFGRREGKLKEQLKESEREKAMLRRGRKIEEEVKNEFEKAKTPEEILRIYRSRTGSN